MLKKLAPAKSFCELRRQMSYLDDLQLCSDLNFHHWPTNMNNGKIRLVIDSNVFAGKLAASADTKVKAEALSDIA